MSTEQTAANTQTTQPGAAAAAALVGGPGGSMDAPAQVPAAAAPTETPIIVGNKSFQSRAEYDAYAHAAINENIGLKTLVQQFVKPQVPAASAPVPQEDLGDLMFQKPAEFATVLQQRATQAAMGQIRQEMDREKMWSDFYSQNPDLARFRKLVELKRQERWDAIKDAPLADALKVLAKETRDELNEIRSTASNGQQMPQTPAITAGASGPPAPAAPQPKAAPMSFVDELKAARKRKG
jgi:hypothetical protein